MNSLDQLAAQDETRTHDAHPSRSPELVTLSDNARSLAAACAIVRNTPEMREQRISDIRHQLSNGTYSVPARVLARKMLEMSSQL